MTRLYDLLEVHPMDQGPEDDIKVHETIAAEMAIGIVEKLKDAIHEGSYSIAQEVLDSMSSRIEDQDELDATFEAAMGLVGDALTKLSRESKAMWLKSLHKKS